MNVISFSLFGTQEKYSIGLLKNLVLAREIYPDWKVMVWYDDTIDRQIYGELCANKDVIITNIGKFALSNRPGMLWRFLAHDMPGVERFICRDADSRLSMREKKAVDEWIESDLDLHIMRDHPHHGNSITAYPIFGGMFGLCPMRDFSMFDWMDNGLLGIEESNLYKRMVDMEFLRKVIYRECKGDMMIHSSIAENFEGETVRPFPSPMVDHRFVGEVYDENDNRAEQYKLWIGKDEVR